MSLVSLGPQHESINNRCVESQISSVRISHEASKEPEINKNFKVDGMMEAPHPTRPIAKLPRCDVQRGRWLAHLFRGELQAGVRESSRGETSLPILGSLPIYM